MVARPQSRGANEHDARDYVIRRACLSSVGCPCAKTLKKLKKDMFCNVNPCHALLADDWYCIGKLKKDMFCNVTRAMLYWLMIGIASVAVSGHRTVVTFENDDVFNSLTPNGFGLHAEGTVNITIKVFPSTPAGSDGHRAYSRKLSGRVAGNSCGCQILRGDV